MKQLHLDCAAFSEPRALCAALADLIALPADCGKNLDALHDWLSTLSEPVSLSLANASAAGEYGQRLVRMLTDTARENPAFTVTVEPEPLTAARANLLGRQMMADLLLRYSPIALKLLDAGDPDPAGTVRPWRDTENRLAMCQAFALVRRNRRAYTMRREDHWCVWPLVSYGLCPLDEADYEYMGTKFFFKDPERSKRFLREEYPMLRDRKPEGFAIAPLESASFVPDLVTIYCTPAQIRTLLLAAKFETGEMLKVTLDPVDSCVHSTIPVLNGQDFNITFPDPGEYERGLTDENEVMFTLRGDRLELLAGSVHMFDSIGFGFRGLQMEMDMNFPRPEFYNKMFEKWGLATGPEWKK